MVKKTYESEQNAVHWDSRRWGALARYGVQHSSGSCSVIRAKSASVVSSQSS